MLKSRKPRLTVALAAVSAAVATAVAQAQEGTMDWPALSGPTIWTAEAEPSWVPSVGSVFDFVADGTGVSYERIELNTGASDPATVPETFTWTASGNVLEIVYDDFETPVTRFVSPPFGEFVDVYGFDQAVADFLLQAFEDGLFDPLTTGPVELIERTVSQTATLGGTQGDRVVVSKTERQEYSIDDLLTSLNWPGDLPRGVVLNDAELLVLLSGAIANGLQSPPAVGDVWAVPHRYSPLDPRLTEAAPVGWHIDVFTLDDTGSTSAGLQSERSFAWSATADGLVLSDGIDSYTYTPIETDGTLFHALVTYAVDGAVLLRSAQWIARGTGNGGGLAPALTEPELPNYWQAGINNWDRSLYADDGQLLPFWVFGYSFTPDGSSIRIIPGFENCLDDEFEPCFTAGFGEPPWDWTADGDTIVREQVFSILTRSRTWTVLGYAQDGRSVVFERALRRFDGEPWFFGVLPRINTLTVFDLSDWPEEWADAEGLYDDTDTDGDGIADAADSCLLVPVADFRDSDDDGIGNVCDTDLNQDCEVNFLDLGIVKGVFFTTPSDANWNPAADFNGDGSVNFLDLGIIKSQFFTTPGPSGVPNLCE